MIPGEGYERDDILRTAACLEEHFPHPVARAVVRKAEQEGLHHQEEHTEVEYVVAHGIASRLHGKRVLFGSRHYIHHDEGVPVDGMREDIERLAREGPLDPLSGGGRETGGLIAIEDPLRPEAAPVILQAARAGNPCRHAHWGRRTHGRRCGRAVGHQRVQVAGLAYGQGGGHPQLFRRKATPVAHARRRDQRLSRAVRRPTWG